MKVFHIRFSTESSDHWSTFVFAESKKDIEKALKKQKKKSGKMLATKHITVAM